MRQRNPHKQKQALHSRRKARVRARVSGTTPRPRLSVARSLAHIQAQIVDDTSGRTLVHAIDTELTPALRKDVGERAAKVAVAYAVGKLVAERAKAAGITQVVFDRGGRAYHGRVRAVAEGARDGGLIF